MCGAYVAAGKVLSTRNNRRGHEVSHASKRQWWANDSSSTKAYAPRRARRSCYCRGNEDGVVWRDVRRGLCMAFKRFTWVSSIKGCALTRSPARNNGWKSTGPKSAHVQPRWHKNRTRWSADTRETQLSIIELVVWVHCWQSYGLASAYHADATPDNAIAVTTVIRRAYQKGEVSEHRL